MNTMTLKDLHLRLAALNVEQTDEFDIFLFNNEVDDILMQICDKHKRTIGVLFSNFDLPPLDLDFYHKDNLEKLLGIEDTSISAIRQDVGVLFTVVF